MKTNHNILDLSDKEQELIKRNFSYCRGGNKIMGVYSKELIEKLEELEKLKAENKSLEIKNDCLRGDIKGANESRESLMYAFIESQRETKDQTQRAEKAEEIVEDLKEGIDNFIKAETENIKFAKSFDGNPEITLYKIKGKEEILNKLKGLKIQEFENGR